MMIVHENEWIIRKRVEEALDSRYEQKCRDYDLLLAENVLLREQLGESVRQYNTEEILCDPLSFEFDCDDSGGGGGGGNQRIEERFANETGNDADNAVAIRMKRKLREEEDEAHEKEMILNRKLVIRRLITNRRYNEERRCVFTYDDIFFVIMGYCTLEDLISLYLTSSTMTRTMSRILKETPLASIGVSTPKELNYLCTYFVEQQPDYHHRHHHHLHRLVSLVWCSVETIRFNPCALKRPLGFLPMYSISRPLLCYYDGLYIMTPPNLKSLVISLYGWVTLEEIFVGFVTQELHIDVYPVLPEEKVSIEVWKMNLRLIVNALTEGKGDCKWKVLRLHEPDKAEPTVF